MACGCTQKIAETVYCVINKQWIRKTNAPRITWNSVSHPSKRFGWLRTCRALVAVSVSSICVRAPDVGKDQLHHHAMEILQYTSCRLWQNTVRPIRQPILYRRRLRDASVIINIGSALASDFIISSERTARYGVCVCSTRTFIVFCAGARYYRRRSGYTYIYIESGKGIFTSWHIHIGLLHIVTTEMFCGRFNHTTLISVVDIQVALVK